MGRNQVEISAKKLDFLFSFNLKGAIEGKKKSARENTKRIYGVEEKSVGKGELNKWWWALFSDWASFLLFNLFKLLVFSSFLYFSFSFERGESSVTV